MGCVAKQTLSVVQLGPCRQAASFEQVSGAPEIPVQPPLASVRTDQPLLNLQAPLRPSLRCPLAARALSVLSSLALLLLLALSVLSCPKRTKALKVNLGT